MQKTFLIRFLVTVLGIGCAVHIIFFTQHGYFPFQQGRHETRILIIQPEHGRTLPAGLRPGDRLDPREQDLTARMALSVNIPPGETYTFVIHRDGRRLKVPVTTRPASSRSPADTAFFGLFLGLLLVLGLTTLWWGSDWSAWGVSIFALSSIFTYFLNLPLPPLASFAALILKYTIFVPLFTVGLYITAFTLAAADCARRLRWLFHLSLTLVLAAEVAIVDMLVILQSIYGIYGAASRFDLIFLILDVISFSIPLITLFTGYGLMDAARRLRLRWVLWSLPLFIAALAWHDLNIHLQFVSRGLIEQLVWWLVDLLALIGLIYGLLFKRLVRLSFIINRAAVYGLTAVVVVAIFALLGTLVQLFAIGGNAGLALTLGVSLGVGLGLEAVKNRIDSLIERLFFRRKYIAESALRRFARQCAFIEQSERLVDEAVTQVHDHLQAPGVALYEHDEADYARLSQCGSNHFPERVEIDDWAFVTLRSEIAETDLATLKSALGHEGYAFPMAVRGTLQGALVVAARPEHYTPDERELLAHVAHQVGVALHALRARDNEKLVRAIASGSLEPDLARKRAQRLCAIKL